MTETRDGRAGRGMIATAAILDIAFVVLFAVFGRRQHGETEALFGLWQTVWPFLAGLAISWIVALVWRRPFAIVRSGVPAWIGTVALGMILRVLFTDGGAPLPFVLVAAAVLGIVLLGWRLLARVFRRVR